MKSLIAKYDRKLIAAGLAAPGAPLFGALDDRLVWSREAAETDTLRAVFDHTQCTALLFAQPAEPYRTAVETLAAETADALCPRDSETRTFQHDFPVIRSFDAETIVRALSRRKSVIVAGRGVITHGAVSPEQAFVSFSSVCFACLVKLLADALAARRAGTLSPHRREIVQRALDHIPPYSAFSGSLMRAPLDSESRVYAAISEAGALTVQAGLVDSYFGNVSFLHSNTLYISQTGSSLDELDGCVDPCPLEGGSCAAITASSELSAHRRIIEASECSAVLHGHPKFAVVLSLDCTRHCDRRDRCHIACPHRRFINEIPIVSGEVGAGPYGLCNTVPPAIRGREGVIVYGHGVFTTGKKDFNEAFARLLHIETMCRREYARLIGD